MALLDDIATYLQAQSIGTVGTDIFKSVMPDQEGVSDDVVILYETGGPPPDRYIPTLEPTWQAYVRAVEYPDAKATAEAIVAALHQKANIELVSGQLYFYFIFLMSGPVFIGRDKNGRSEFSINFQARVRNE